MKTTVYLVRHAQAAGNLEGRFQGHTDAALSELGQRQLAALSERCKDLSIDAIFSSPLRRALETARAVNRYHQLPILEEPGLIEINGGGFEERRWEELPVLYAEQYACWKETPWAFEAPEGESMHQVFVRMRETALRLVKQNRGKNIVFVSHGCALKNLLCWASGYPLEKILEVGWCDNASLSRIDFDGQDRPEVVFSNDVEHLRQSGLLKTWMDV